MQLREIMTSPIFCASPSDSISKVATDMKRHNVGVIPVCQDGRLLGLVTDRDIVLECVASGADPKDSKVSNYMTTELLHGTPDMDVVDAARLMGKEQLHRLPVVENGRLTGIVSVGDIAAHCTDDRLVAQLLREISMPVRSFKPAAVAA